MGPYGARPDHQPDEHHQPQQPGRSDLPQLLWRAHCGQARWAAVSCIVTDIQAPSVPSEAGSYLKYLASGGLTLVLPVAQGYSDTLSPDMSRLAYAQSLALGAQRVVERELRSVAETRVSGSSQRQPGNRSFTLSRYSGKGRALAFCPSPVTSR